MIIRYKQYEIEGSSLRMSGVGIPFELKMITPPSKTSYLVGETPSTKGMILRAVVENSEAYFNVPLNEVTVIPQTITETDTIVTYIWRGMKVSVPIRVYTKVIHPTITALTGQEKTSYESGYGVFYCLEISASNLIMAACNGHVLIFEGKDVIKNHTIVTNDVYATCYNEDTDQFVVITTSTMTTYFISGTTGEIIETYTPTNRMTPYAAGLAYHNDIYVLATNNTSSNVFYSTDAKTWTRVSTVKNIGAYCIFWGADKFVLAPATGNNEFFYSYDGMEWLSGGPLPETGTNILTGGYVNGLYYLIKNSGSSIYISDDGITWTKVTNAQGGYWRGSCIAQGNIVSMSYNGSTPTGRNAVVSEDGTEWKLISVGSITNQNWVALVYNPELDLILASSGDSIKVLQWIKPTWKEPDEE